MSPMIACVGLLWMTSSAATIVEDSADCDAFPKLKNQSDGRAMLQHSERYRMPAAAHLHTKAVETSTAIMMSEVAFLGTDGELTAKANAPQFLVPDVPCEAGIGSAPPSNCKPLPTVIRLASDTSKCLGVQGCSGTGTLKVMDCATVAACDSWNVYPSWGYVADGSPGDKMRRGRITWVKDPSRCLGLQGKGGAALSSPGSPVLLEACDDDNPNAWEQQWFLFPDMALTGDGMGSVVSSLGLFTKVGMGSCLKADGMYEDIGWAPCTCSSYPCTQTVGNCPEKEDCANECAANKDCAAFSYYDNHCWLLGGKQTGATYTQSKENPFYWYECWALK